MNTVTGQQEDMILVPRIPTAEMLEAASDEAHAENAAGVWKYMIAEYELTSKQRKSQLS